MKISRERLCILGVVSLVGTTGFMYTSPTKSQTQHAVLAQSDRKIQRAEDLILKQKPHEIRPMVANLHPYSAD